MFFEEDDKQYRLVAPDVDELLRFFDHGLLNPTRSTSQLSGAAESLFDMADYPEFGPIKNEKATSTIGWSSETELADEDWARVRTALETAIKQK